MPNVMHVGRANVMPARMDNRLGRLTAGASCWFDLWGLRRPKRLLKLTPAAAEQTTPFGCLIGHPPRERLEAASASAAFLFGTQTQRELKLSAVDSGVRDADDARDAWQPGGASFMMGT